jgi:amino acid transporter
MAADPTYETLGRGQLTLLDVIAQSIGFIGPVFASAFFISTIAGASFTGKGAGIAVPISIILAAVGMLGVAWIISRFARRIHAAGSLYDYVTDGFGRRAGFLAGWIYYGGMSALTLAIGLAFGGFLSSTLIDTVDVHIAWYWLAIAFWIVAFGMQYVGVQVSTRAQLVLALGSMLIIGGFAVYIILKGAGGGNSTRPFDPGESTASGIFYGVLYAVIMFIGFETAANLAEETADPQRLIPRAVLISVVAAAIFYVLVAYALLIVFGLNLDTFLKSFPQLAVAAGGGADPSIGSTRFGELTEWLITVDIAAVALGTATGSSRGIFALARDGRLPKVLAAVHPKHKTPWVSALAASAAAIVVIIIVHATNGLVLNDPANDPGEWFGFFQWGAAFGGFCLVLVYLAISLTGFLGQPGENRIALAVAGAVGTVTMLAAIYGVVKGAPELWRLDRVWWIALIWIGLGIGALALLQARGAFEVKTAAETRALSD